MVEWTRWAVRSAVAACLVAAVVALATTLPSVGPPGPSPVFHAERSDDARFGLGEPIRLGDLPEDGALKAAIDGEHGVIILHLDGRAFDDAQREDAIEVPALRLSDGGVVVAYDIKSPILGCSIELWDVPYAPDHDGDPAEYLFDPCHPEGHWDPYRGGVAIGPGHGGLDDLQAYEVVAINGALYVRT